MKNHELKPISTGAINQGSQSGVSMVRDLWRKGCTKKVSFEFRVKGWWMEKVEKRQMGWGKHKEVKLVHEVKMEVYSRDEVRHTEKSDLWSSGKRRQWFAASTYLSLGRWLWTSDVTPNTFALLQAIVCGFWSGNPSDLLQNSKTRVFRNSRI